MTRNNSRLELIEVEADAAVEDLADAVRAGLGTDRKTLPCRFFYDEAGSNIFEQICEQPEYYPTRAEREILTEHAAEVAELFASRTVVVELGSGSSTKTRLLIEAFLQRHGALRYVPVDISRSILEESAQALLDSYPGLEILAIAAEYHHGLHKLRAATFDRKLIVWLGSSIGNFDPAGAGSFLKRVRQAMDDDDRLLVGMDLRKSAEVLERAYDDTEGVTARFNKNLLARINRELDADFDLDAFEHRALWNEEAGRVEMHLESTSDQVAEIGKLDMSVELSEGETIHTENSYKFSLDEIRTIGAEAGYRLEKQWFDSGRRFSLNLYAPACSS